MPSPTSPQNSQNNSDPDPAPKKLSKQDIYLDKIKSQIEAANSVLILLPQNHNVDNVAAGLSLYLALNTFYNHDQNTKQISIASPTQTTVAYQRLYAVADITNQLGSKNLVITFNTNFEDIEEVTSDNTEGKFNLIVKTKDGINKLESNDFSFSYRGVDADLVITIDYNTPEDAGSFYLHEKDLFKDRAIINLSANPNSVPFAETYLKNQNASGSCELVASILRFMQINIDPDTATNLIAGIESITHNFSQKSGADTFSLTGSLLRFGGQRFHLSQPANLQNNAFSGFYPRALNQNSNNEPSQPVNDNTKDKKDWTQPKIFKAGDSISKV